VCFEILLDQSKEDELGGACSTHVGEMRSAYSISVGKPEGKMSLRRSRRRRDDNIRMNLREIRWEVVELINLPQGRDQWLALVNTVM
jgi:hypothetical protein